VLCHLLAYSIWRWPVDISKKVTNPYCRLLSVYELRHFCNQPSAKSDQRSPQNENAILCCVVEATAHLRGVVIGHTGMMELRFAGEYRKRSGGIHVFRCHFLYHESHGTEPATTGWAAAGIRVISLQLWHIKITLQLANWAKYWEEGWSSKNRLWAVTVFSLLVQTRRNVMWGWGEVALTEWFGAPRRDSLAKGLSAAYIRFTER